MKIPSMTLLALMASSSVALAYSTGSITSSSNVTCPAGVGNDSYVTGCKEVVVSCPDANDVTATLRYSFQSPLAESVGSIVFFDSMFGGGFYGDNFVTATNEYGREIRNTLIDEGYRTVEVKWEGGWNDAITANMTEPLSQASCIGATVMDWMFGLSPFPAPYCATGQSGGAAFLSAAATKYPNAYDDLSAIVVTGGPNNHDIDSGCRDIGSNWEYSANTKLGNYDRIYKELSGDTAPCINADATYSTHFVDDSLMTNTLAVSTSMSVSIIVGEGDHQAVLTHSEGFADFLEFNKGLTDVSHHVLAGVRHGVPKTDAGAGLIVDRLLITCQ
jgi:hypothetical protein